MHYIFYFAFFFSLNPSFEKCNVKKFHPFFYRQFLCGSLSRICRVALVFDVLLLLWWFLEFIFLLNFHVIHKISRMIVIRPCRLHHIISVNAFGACLSLTSEFFITGTAPRGRDTIITYFIKPMIVMNENFTLSISDVLSKWNRSCGMEPKIIF